MLKVGLLLVFLLAYAAYIVYTAVIGGVWTVALYVFIFGAGSIAAILMRRWRRKEDEFLNYSLTGQTPQRHFNGAFDLAPSVRTYLEDRILILAALLARGASEIHIHQDRDGEPGEVFTRQIVNGFLRKHGLWNKLEPEEADLASAADGRWTTEQADYTVLRSEYLRLLRWVLGIDAEIIPLWHYPTLDFKLSLDLLQSAAAARSRRSTVGPWDVRLQRDLARDYTARVIAELKARGLVPSGPELDSWADELRAKSLGDSMDLLTGVHTIAELDENALRLLGTLAAAREGYASYLVEQLDSSEPFPFSSWEACRIAQD